MVNISTYSSVVTAAREAEDLVEDLTKDATTTQPSEPALDILDELPKATPSPTESPNNVVDTVTDTIERGWDSIWGVPFKIVLIVVVSAVFLLLLRRLIKKVTEKLAQDPESSWLSNSEHAGALKAVNPLANARRAQRSRSIGSVLRSVSSIVVGAIAVFMILDLLKVNVAPLLASAGVVGVAIGFGAQSLVKDFLSGVFLILEDQYGVGDKVQIGLVNGTVESIALRITKVRDADGTLWYLRNGEVLTVGNKTHGWAIAAIEVKVPYMSNLDQVREALEAAAADVKREKSIASSLRGPIEVSGIESMTASTLSLSVTVKTLPAKQWEVARALRASIRTVLTERGIEMASGD